MHGKQSKHNLNFSTTHCTHCYATQLLFNKKVMKTEKKYFSCNSLAIPNYLSFQKKLEKFKQFKQHSHSSHRPLLVHGSFVGPSNTFWKEKAFRKVHAAHSVVLLLLYYSCTKLRYRRQKREKIITGPCRACTAWHWAPRVIATASAGQTWSSYRHIQPGLSVSNPLHLTQAWQTWI